MTIVRWVFTLTAATVFIPLHAAAGDLQLSDYVGVWRGKDSCERIIVKETSGKLTITASAGKAHPSLLRHHSPSIRR